MSTVQSYDFLLPPKGTYILDASGSYFAVQSLSVNSSIGVRGAFGDFSPCDAGQGIKGVPYSRLEIRNLTSVQVTGVMLVSDYELVNRQLTGSVDISNIVTTTSAANQSALAQKSFAITTYLATTTANQTLQIAFRNTLPDASTKRQYINRIIISGTTNFIYSIQSANTSTIGGAMTASMAYGSGGKRASIVSNRATASIQALGLTASTPPGGQSSWTTIEYGAAGGNTVTRCLDGSGFFLQSQDVICVSATLPIAGTVYATLDYDEY